LRGFTRALSLPGARFQVPCVYPFHHLGGERNILQERVDAVNAARLSRARALRFPLRGFFCTGAMILRLLARLSQSARETSPENALRRREGQGEKTRRRFNRRKPKNRFQGRLSRWYILSRKGRRFAAPEKPRGVRAFLEFRERLDDSIRPDDP
jgi:hypothetical protein